MTTHTADRYDEHAERLQVCLTHFRQFGGRRTFGGLRGLMQSAANELGFSGIRVNSIHPGTVTTEGMEAMVELTGGSMDDMQQYTEGQIFKTLMAPQEISNAVLFLASDESRLITGLEFAVDAGFNVKV
jgi:NAD(P)-dependent dehydrogenase (short-subunit alcohol dehydrogenase family)